MSAGAALAPLGRCSRSACRHHDHDSSGDIDSAAVAGSALAADRAISGWLADDSEAETKGLRLGPGAKPAGTSAASGSALTADRLIGSQRRIQDREATRLDKNAAAGAVAARAGGPAAAARPPLASEVTKDGENRAGAAEDPVMLPITAGPWLRQPPP